MKVVILAGGFGSRLGELTDQIPKPMVLIGGMPIIWHIMNIYAKEGHKDFIIALGYKAEVIKQFFLNFKSLSSDFTVNLKSGTIEIHSGSSLDWNVTLVDTGINSMTGGRLLKLKEYLKNEPFMLTYGDGVSDININELLDFHNSSGKMVTVSAVHPAARFGEIDLCGDLVRSFKEKPQTHDGWINGGFFVVEPEFLELIDNEKTILEGRPLEILAERGELAAYRHNGFWQCMDTMRDKIYLETLWQAETAPWKVW